MKHDNGHFASNACRGNQLVGSGKDVAGRAEKALLIGNLFHSLIKDVERLNSFISIRLAICNLVAGVDSGVCRYFPVLTKKQEMLKRVNHGMKTVDHFVAAQLMRRNHFQRTFALSQGCANNSPSGVKFSVIASAGCASKGGSGLLQSFVCTNNKSGHCRSATRHYSYISLSKKPRGVCILPTHYINCHSQSGNGAYCLYPSGPIGLREFVVVSQNDDIDNAKNYQKCDREVGVFHALAESCLKGILA